MLNFIYPVVYTGDKVAEVDQCSELLLYKLEKEYPAMFSKPMNPI